MALAVALVLASVRRGLRRCRWRGRFRYCEGRSAGLLEEAGVGSALVAPAVVVGVGVALFELEGDAVRLRDGVGLSGCSACSL